MEMKKTADVAIVGGGIVGASIAWHLAEAGCSRVLLLEREKHQGKGSTGKSMGGVRAQFSSAPNIRMSRYSIPFYADFEERIGHPCGYRPQGYLFLATSQAQVEYLRNNRELQREYGVDVQVLTTEEVQRAYPQLVIEDVLGANFCPTDGFVDPYSAMVGLTKRACEMGAELWREAEVIAISRDSEAFTLHTTRGEVSAGRVVIAAGAWSAAVAAMLGLELPVEPLRRMLVPTEPFDRFPHSAPMIIDMSNGFHFRPEGAGFLLAWNDPEETVGFKTDFVPEFIEKILTRAAARVPVFENLAVNPKRAWAGLYEMTPDHHPVLGPVRAVPGSFIAAGFSGHGVMHAPATGKILADCILQGTTDLIDVNMFTVERFSEGRLVHESAVL